MSFAVSGAPPGLEALAGIFAPAVMGWPATSIPGKAPTGSLRSWCMATTPGRACGHVAGWWWRCACYHKHVMLGGQPVKNQPRLLKVGKGQERGHSTHFFLGDSAKSTLAGNHFTKIRTQGVTLEAKTTPRGSQHHADD